MEEQTITHVTEKPNSFEVGKIGNRFKIYYGEVKELAEHIAELKKEDLFYEEE